MVSNSVSVKQCACAVCSSVQCEDSFWLLPKTVYCCKPLESRLAEFESQTAWTKTDCTASRLDVGVISRCLVCLADVEFAEIESLWCPVM